MGNKKITGYIVVSYYDSDDLVEAVQSKLADGWQPFGNLIATPQRVCEFTQAMVKYAE